jgi:hypothetical protein
VLPDEKYDRAFRIKVSESWRRYFSLLFLINFFFVVLPDEKYDWTFGIKVREGWGRCYYYFL